MKVRHPSLKLNQRGDTLIEVTFALVILAAVLVSSSLLAVKGLQQAHSAQERTQIADEAQRQAEGLRSFRDNHTWAEFLNGSGGIYSGVLNGGGSTCQASGGPCFHVDTRATVPGITSEFVPLPNNMAGSVATSYIEIKATPDGAAPPQSVDVVISYGFLNAGGGPMNEGHIKLRFTNLKLGLATPTPAPTPTPGPATPTPTPAGCAAAKDIVLVMDASASMLTPWGGTTRKAKAIQTANAFVDAMQISGPRNHMGVVQFNSVPTVLSPIVFDTAALHSAINGYTTSANTRITPALVMADTMLQASVRPLAPKVIVLMSDGLPDAGDKAIFVQAEAGVLSSEGIRVYTVYIGDDGGLGALAFMNSLKGNGGKSANAVNPGDLDGIMADIANIEGCN
jgi:hypothetical protein